MPDVEKTREKFALDHENAKRKIHSYWERAEHWGKVPEHDRDRKR